MVVKHIYMFHHNLNSAPVGVFLAVLDGVIILFWKMVVLQLRVEKKPKNTLKQGSGLLQAER